MTRTINSLAQVVARAAALARQAESEMAASFRGRVILGIVGAPGSGKSTISSAIEAALGPERAVVVPMDGFHLANTQLREQGLADVKGNIATFDADGYAALLHRLAHQGADETVYAPYFDRWLEESIGSAIRVDPRVPLVVTEGNYLLCDGPAWQRARASLTQSWYVHVPRDLRVRWLIDRHIAHGRSTEAAREWVLRSDEANARLVEATCERADVRIELPITGDPGPTVTAR